MSRPPCRVRLAVPPQRKEGDWQAGGRMSQLTLGSRRGTIFVRASARRGESRDVGRVPSAASFSLGRVGARANSRQPESVAKVGTGQFPAKSVKERIPPLPLDAADRGARLRVPSRKRRVSSVDPRPAGLSPPKASRGARRHRTTHTTGQLAAELHPVVSGTRREQMPGCANGVSPSLYPHPSKVASHLRRPRPRGVGGRVWAVQPLTATRARPLD
jgi:hypothetical protein